MLKQQLASRAASGTNIGASVSSSSRSSHHSRSLQIPQRL
jgi:hypothetical protein